MKTKKHIPFYLLVISIFCGLISPLFLTEEMFLDGITYASIANNLANDLGSFWNPHYSATLFPQFHEHPPLAFGLQSIWYRVFGDSIWVEKFYSLLTFLLVAFAIIKLWKHITNDQKTAWIPLLFWVIIPDVTWAASSNILENTMSVFVSFSVLFFLKSKDKKHFFFMMISGTLLSLAFLTKGFTGLYIFSLPFFLWLFWKKESFKNMISDSFLLVLFTIIPIGVLFLIFPDSYQNISNYIETQVMGSIQNTITVNSRFQILIDFFSKILPVLILGFILFLTGIYHKTERNIYSKHKSIYFFLFALTLAGVLPIMISLKQRGFYILTVYPFFSLGFGLVFYPLIKKYTDSINVNNIRFKIGRGLSIIVLFFCVFLIASNFNTTTRDQELISATHLIKDEIGEDKIISITPQLNENWLLYAYFMRNSSITLSSDENNLEKYYFTTKKYKDKVNKEVYREIKLGLETYFLFEKK